MSHTKRALSKKHLAFYISMGVPIVVVELIAATNSERGDTISEMFWALMEFSNLAWIGVSGFTLWLFLHFALNKFKH